jgi:hypothetical protein
VVQDFGQEEYVRAVKEITLPAITLKSMASRNGVTFDYIKTDIEGLDGPVACSAPEVVERSLVMTMELRFLPFYEGEPHFDEVVKFMRELGFDVLRLDIEHWRYATKNRKSHLDGRSVYANTTFVRSVDRILEGPDSQHLFVKQIVILCMVGYPSYAEHLLENYLGNSSPDLQNELSRLIQSSVVQGVGPLARFLDLPELSNVYWALRRKVAMAVKRRRFKMEHVGR